MPEKSLVVTRSTSGHVLAIDDIVGQSSKDQHL
jgi:hypothetical protein